MGLLSMLLFACSGSTPSTDESPTEQAIPSRTAIEGPVQPTDPVAELACPNRETLAADVAAQPGTEVDIDSDGSFEEISVGRDPQGPSGCQAVLVASGDAIGPLAVEIEGEPSFELGLPAVLGTAEVDGSPPEEIIVNVASGASTGFVALFSVLNGGLIRRVLEGDSPYTNLFPFGGSVGHIEGSDCASGGRIVIASAIPSGNGYVVQRRFFERSGAAFVLDESSTETSQVATDDLARIAEFGGTPFSSCPQ